MTQRVETNGYGNQRERILAVLQQAADTRGYVRSVDVQGICRQTGIDPHDVVKHLWGLQKQSLLGFSTRHLNGTTVPFRFRLRGDAIPGRSVATDGPQEAQTAPNTGEGSGAPSEAAGDADPLGGFPLIRALLGNEGRRAKVVAAAKALEEAGLDDLAIQALEQAPELTPLEREVVALAAILEEE